MLSGGQRPLCPSDRAQAVRPPQLAASFIGAPWLVSDTEPTEPLEVLVSCEAITTLLVVTRIGASERGHIDSLVRTSIVVAGRRSRRCPRSLGAPGRRPFLAT